MSKCISQLQLNEWECNQCGVRAVCCGQTVGRTADTIGLGITNTDTCGAEWSPSARPSD